MLARAAHAEDWFVYGILLAAYIGHIVMTVHLEKTRPMTAEIKRFQAAARG